MENFLLLPRVVAAASFDLAFACAMGVCLGRLWLGVHATGELLQILDRTRTFCATVMLVTLPIQLWLLAAIMIGSTSPLLVRTQLLDVLTGTHAGRVLIPAFCCASMLFLLSLCTSLARTSQAALSLFLLGVLTVAKSVSGHAASSEPVWMSEIVQFLHLSAISIWAGGVIIAGLILLPSLQTVPTDVAQFGKRLSNAATVALALVLLSGMYNAWRGLDGSLRPLTHSQWGFVLSLKTTLVVIAVGLGALNRTTIHRGSLMTSTDSTRLVARMRWEAWIMVAILILSGWLANSAPPASL